MLNCIVLELTNGTTVAYSYPDEHSAQEWYRECRLEWNEGRTLTFHMPKRSRGAAMQIHPADDVAHLGLATRDELTARGIDYAEAVTFG